MSTKRNVARGLMMRELTGNSRHVNEIDLEKHQCDRLAIRLNNFWDQSAVEWDQSAEKMNELTWKAKPMKMERIQLNAKPMVCKVKKSR